MEQAKSRHHSPSVCRCTSVRAGLKLPVGERRLATAQALKRNEAELATKAHLYPNCMVLMPPSIVPMVRVSQAVVWVNALAVWSSSGVLMRGKIALRPLVKNGEANIKS